eukprot:s5997_g1.t1
MAGRHFAGEEVSHKDAHTMVAVAKGGLKLKLSDGSDLCLQFNGTCELYGAKTIRHGVLYRPRGHNYPSIDACGIPNGEEAKKFYFIQIATGREHTRIQKTHLDRIQVPKAASGGVVCLYIDRWTATELQAALELVPKGPPAAPPPLSPLPQMMLPDSEDTQAEFIARTCEKPCCAEVGLTRFQSPINRLLNMFITSWLTFRSVRPDVGPCLSCHVRQSRIVCLTPAEAMSVCAPLHLSICRW